MRKSHSTRTHSITSASRWCVNRWITLSLLGAGFILGGLAEPGPASAQPPTSQVVSQWQQAGAEAGWITIDSRGGWQFDRDPPPDGGLLAFRFGKFPSGRVKPLPAPDGPFGLWLGHATTDADLAELADFTQLQALYLEGNYARSVTG